MDNEQKYKNALEKVKELLDSAKNQGHIIVRVEDIENAFPELKESEDEKIRKEFCKDIRTFIPIEKANKYIAWLEKQKPVSITDEWIEDYWQHEKVINPYSYDKGEEIQFDHQGFVNFCKKYCKKPVKQNKEDEITRKSLIRFLKSPFINENITDEKVAPWIAWLENQKGACDMEYVFRPLAGDTIEKAAEKAVELDGRVVLAFNGAYIPVDNKTKNEIVAEYHDWIKKQGKQTHAELGQSEVSKTSDQELEPKFHPGDWIVTENSFGKNVLHIDEIRFNLNGKEYIVSDVNGLYIISSSNEHKWHKWTILDAEDGDVLYYECNDNKNLFIVKSVGETKDHVEGHFWYSITRDECEVWDGRLPYSNIASMCNAMPATKEQRDLLFSKMKEVGYDWDSEKKKLSYKHL